MRKAIVGAKVVAPDRVIPAGTVVIDDGVIADVLPHADSALAADKRFDGTGLILAPGFIDLQINGGFGLDLASDPRSIWELGAQLSSASRPFCRQSSPRRWRSRLASC